MDAFDRAILAIVQADNQLTDAEIGARVNLSGSAVRRRLRALRAQGVILADVAIVDPDRLGLTMIVQVAFDRDSPEAYDAFRDQMAAAAEVSQCYSVSGAFDFVLVAHAVSPAAYEEWAREALMRNPAIRRHETYVVWSRSKFTTAVTPAGARSG